ncbi:hypothetical protein SAMN06297129_2377 [Pseudooceanicola antarcticus]|uniref:Uncharacterized protein n=1 Tax=Pseudooceanicola antarcticus TaxID=1247613 RepID=A0A285IXF6_9RHOB|nr:hypothetical protein SAMN06297129_2377 [Pseudooceanicola antarcticus]
MQRDLNQCILTLENTRLFLWSGLQGHSKFGQFCA